MVFAQEKSKSVKTLDCLLTNFHFRLFTEKATIAFFEKKNSFGCFLRFFTYKCTNTTFPLKSRKCQAYFYGGDHGGSIKIGAQKIKTHLNKSLSSKTGYNH